MPESAAYLVADHRDPHRASNGEPDPGRFVGLGAALQVQNHTRPSGTIAVPDGRSEIFTPPHPVDRRQHGYRRSDRDAGAPLATARGKDRAPRTGAHSKPEAMLLVPAAVVRLESTLAHLRLQ